jgi:molybdopterin/thiamine biosynthesis adenylyltransferase
MTTASISSAPTVPSLVLVGLGNILSHLVEHVARLSQLRRVILIDPDVYEERNFQSQCILRSDLGQPKVQVQASKLRVLNPSLEVVPFVESLEEVPLGWFRTGLIVSGLDGLASRLALGQAAWRSGSPWLDGGVEPDFHLCRVSGYLPRQSNPCFECALEEEDYRLRLSHRHPCGRAGAENVPTGGTSGLGAMCAALLAQEIGKILAGHGTASLLGRQLVMDSRHYTLSVSRLRRNPACRFDHGVWPIHPLPDFGCIHSLRELWVGARKQARMGRRAVLSLEGRPFVRVLRCPGCLRAVRRFHLWGRLLPREDRFCASCGGREMIYAGADADAFVSVDTPAALLAEPLARLGFRAGDVVTMDDGRRRSHFEIGGKAL